MKKLLAICTFLAIAAAILPALPDYLQRSDELSFADKNNESVDLLLDMLPTAKTGQEQVEIYWRLSRDTFLDVDNRRFASASADLLLSLYRKAESYADQVIALDPNNPQAFFWKASSIGREGQAGGGHPSLSQADTMRKLLTRAVQLDPHLSGPWFVLGQLYEQVPGWPISFGNAEGAVSLGRKSLDVGQEEVSRGAQPIVPFDYSVQLARHLSKRNWSNEKRSHEQADEARKFNATNDLVEKSFSYEGIIQIPQISDRAEARELCQFVISQLEDVSSRTPGQERDLKSAQETLAALGE